jgi:hypothetical protein
MNEYIALAVERTPVYFRGEASPLPRTSLRVAPLCGGSAPATPPGLAVQRPPGFFRTISRGFAQGCFHS